MKFIKIQDVGNGMVLRTVKSTDFGFVEDNAIFVNVEKIWKMSANFNDFADEFDTTCSHELLHIMIEQEIGDTASIVGEEKTVRMLTGEVWNKKLEKEYLEDENE
ncbi:MAG: hypothetical protein MAG795_00004 [Candidatus Woesearchaeota archaeon]|nr:hypothetical protein [Candidatus Woesearchaeota archaeon]